MRTYETARGEKIGKNRATHGDCRVGDRAPEYGVWRAMNDRCHLPSSEKYPLYGARGIVVCQEWRSDYLAFLSHIGRRPSPAHSIERIDNNKGYEPGNVRWATRKEQARNTRSNHFLEAFGRRATIVQWAEETGKPSRLISKRISLGWTPERALTTEVETEQQRRTRATQQAADKGNRIGKWQGK